MLQCVSFFSFLLLLSFAERRRRSVFHQSSPSLTALSPQCTGSSWAWSRGPSCPVAPPPCTCATTCWSSPEACRPSPSATGSCRRSAATAPCPTASCSREGLAAATVSSSSPSRSCLLNSYYNSRQEGSMEYFTRLELRSKREVGGAC